MSLGAAKLLQHVELFSFFYIKIIIKKNIFVSVSGENKTIHSLA